MCEPPAARLLRACASAGPRWRRCTHCTLPLHSHNTHTTCTRHPQSLPCQTHPVFCAPAPQKEVKARNANYEQIVKQLTFRRKPWFAAPGSEEGEEDDDDLASERGAGAGAPRRPRAAAAGAAELGGVNDGGSAGLLLRCGLLGSVCISYPSRATLFLCPPTRR